MIAGCVSHTDSKGKWHTYVESAASAPQLPPAVAAAMCCVQVSEAVAAAEPFREQLQRRGVFVVPLPVYGDDTGAVRINASDASNAFARVAAWCSVGTRCLLLFSLPFCSTFAPALLERKTAGLICIHTLCVTR
jgi:hypothetical protein